SSTRAATASGRCMGRSTCAASRRPRARWSGSAASVPSPEGSWLRNVACLKRTAFSAEGSYGFFRPVAGRLPVSERQSVLLLPLEGRLDDLAGRVLLVHYRGRIASLPEGELLLRNDMPPLRGAPI